MNLWLQRALLLLAGIAVGFSLRPAHSASRFVWDKDSTYALDTKTGQVCAPFAKDTTELPRCLDVYKRY
jgi:hypothetical protein